MITWDDMIYDGEIVSRGTGSTDGKSIYINSKLTKRSMNNYRLTVELQAKGPLTFNNYGQRVYAHIGNKQVLLGTQVIEKKNPPTVYTFTHDFSITKDTTCYASTICVNCEKGAHTLEAKFKNKTTTDKAVYEVPYTAPSDASVTLNKSSVAEGNVKATASYTCSKPTGTPEYQFRYRVDGGAWKEQSWSTNKTFTLNVTSTKRGGLFDFAVRVKNGAGTSSWSSNKSIKANSIPPVPGSLKVNNSRPIGDVTLSWGSVQDADGQTVTYGVYLSKDGGSTWSNIGSTTSTSHTYSTSSDTQGTHYKFYVTAKDTLNASCKSSSSSSFYKATKPKNAKASFNKTGVVEGSVTATATYESPYSTGTIQYQFSYKYDGIDWKDQGWKTDKTYSIDTSTKRGKKWYVRVRVKNDAGTSDWSSAISVTANMPPSKPTGIANIPKWPTNELKLTWEKSTDSNGLAINYKVYLQKNSGVYQLITDTTSLECKTSVSNDPEGTAYKCKVVAYNTLGSSAESDESETFYKPTTPTNIYFTVPSQNDIAEYGYAIKWTQSSFGRLAGKYQLEIQKNGGTWAKLLTTDKTSYSFDIGAINRGEVMKFRVKAVNEVDMSSQYAYSPEIKRNRIPGNVSNIKPASGYAVSIVDFSWDRAVDPDNHEITYYLYKSKNGGAYESIGVTTNTNFKWAIPSADPGQTAYQIRIDAKDELGAISQTIGPVIKKATPPDRPTNLMPLNGFFEGNVRFYWTASNFHNSNPLYDIRIYVDGVLTKEDITHSASYVFWLNGVRRGAAITYEVKARNEYNQETAWVKCEGTVYHNQIPDPPTFILPLQNSSVLAASPRIVFKSGYEHDGQKMQLHVKYNGKTFDSITNAASFTAESFGNEEYVVFTGNSPLNEGENTITAWTYDGLVCSEQVTMKLTARPMLETIPDSDEYIQYAPYEKMDTAVNLIKKAYGINDHTKVEDGFITDVHINTLVKDMHKVMDKIESYNTGSRKIFSKNEFSVSKSDFVTKEPFNNLIREINKV